MVLAGTAGSIFWRFSIARAASISLLALLIWGKVATTILKGQSPDTAVLLVEFTAILVLMEAASTLHIFDREFSLLKSREDDVSGVLRAHLQVWIRNQLTNQARLGVVMVVLSVVLLPVAGFTSLANNQIVFSATLALLAVMIILFLATHRREPDTS